MLKIVSIDIGSKHMVIMFMSCKKFFFTQRTKKNFEEFMQHVISVDNVMLISPGVSVLEYLKNLEKEFDDCHCFVVERQMNINRKAIILQTQIEIFFKIIYSSFKLFCLFDSKKKTNLLYDDDQVLTYRERKQKTVRFAAKYNVPFIDGYKKDDIADAFCQGVAYLWELFSYEIIV